MKRALAGPALPARVLALVLAAGGALAGVEGTHHDLRLYNLAGEQSVCAYCHVPHGAQSEDNLFARRGTGEGLGPIGAFCYSCHDGTVIPTALVEASDGTVGLEALTGSHGYSIDRINAVTQGLETAESVFGSGLIRETATAALLFDCNACHDPHSDQNPPFLRAPLAELCQKCHSGKDRLGKGRWTQVQDTGGANWAHPVGMPVRESGAEKVRGLPSEMSFHGPDPVFDVPARSAQELRDPSVHWEMGGHLLGADRSVGCATCHSAHLPRRDLLVAQADPEPTKVGCSGCHTDGLNRENPGVTPYYHPVLDSALPPYEHDHASHGDVGDPNIPRTGTIDLFVEMPEEWPLGLRGELLCETCHRAHRGVPGERALRWSPKGELLICNECHGTGEQTASVNRHHPTGPKNYTDPSVNRFPTEIGWMWGKELPGDLSDGLQCVDCHTELAKSGHNW